MDEQRNAISENLIKKYNESVDREEEVKKLDKLFKDLSREVQGLSREKEAIEKQQTKAIKKLTEVELDVADLQERIMTSNRAKVLWTYKSITKTSSFCKCAVTTQLHYIYIFNPRIRCVIVLPLLMNGSICFFEKT